MTAVDLDALDKLQEAAAADLPWRVGAHYAIHVYGGPDEQTPVGTCHQQSDAALIVAAVNALSDLIAEARELRALREAIEGLAKELGREWDQSMRYGRGHQIDRIAAAERVRALLAGGDQ